MMDVLDAKRSALLLMDFQNYGLHPEGYWAKQGIPTWPSGAYPAVENAARVLATARKTPLTIIHIAARWRPGSPEMNTNIPVFARGPDRSVEGTWDADFYDPVKPAEGEVVITKRSVSPFIGTELDRFLRIRDINTIVCAGVATNYVVESAVREGVDRGLRAIVLADCCASVTEEMHNFSVQVILPDLCTVTTADELIQLLTQSP
jgi:nicotinamidase-related amidase